MHFLVFLWPKLDFSMGYSESKLKNLAVLQLESWVASKTGQGCSVPFFWHQRIIPKFLIFAKGKSIEPAGSTNALVLVSHLSVLAAS